VDSLAGRVHHAKNRRRRTGICTLWRNLSKELRTGEVLKVDTGCIVGFTKDVDYDIEFIGGIKNSILVEKVCSTPTFEALEPFTYNLYLSDSLTELLLQHLKQEEIAAVRKRTRRVRKFTGWR
jgi:hypothetical protein